MLGCWELLLPLLGALLIALALFRIGCGVDIVPCLFLMMSESLFPSLKVCEFEQMNRDTARGESSVAETNIKINDQHARRFQNEGCYVVVARGGRRRGGRVKRQLPIVVVVVVTTVFVRNDAQKPAPQRQESRQLR